MNLGADNFVRMAVERHILGKVDFVNSPRLKNRYYTPRISNCNLLYDLLLGLYSDFHGPFLTSFYKIHSYKADYATGFDSFSPSELMMPEETRMFDL